MQYNAVCAVQHAMRKCCKLREAEDPAKRVVCCSSVSGPRQHSICTSSQKDEIFPLHFPEQWQIDFACQFEEDVSLVVVGARQAFAAEIERSWTVTASHPWSDDCFETYVAHDLLVHSHLLVTRLSVVLQRER